MDVMVIVSGFTRRQNLTVDAQVLFGSYNLSFPSVMFLEP